MLHGQLDAGPKLCDLEGDPTCSFDRRPLYPIVTLAMFRRLAVMDRHAGAVLAREQVTIDSEMAAMLRVWGTY